MSIHSVPQLPARWLSAGATCAALLLICGISSSCGSNNPSRNEPAINVGLNALEAGEESSLSLPDEDQLQGRSSIEERIAQQAADLQALMQQATAAPSGARPLDNTMSPSESSIEITPLDPASDPQLSITQQDTGMGIGLGSLLGDDIANNSADATGSRIAALANEIESLVQSRAATSNTPFHDALALIAADLLRPSGPTGQDTIDPLTLESLSPAERKTLDALRSSLRELAGASPNEVAASMGQAAERLERSLGARIGRAELCSRVDSFGSYVPFAGNDFLARQAHRALVYVEVERFSHRATTDKDRVNTPGDRWAVELSKELRLYHAADGRLAWRQPAQRVVDTSRNRRRDFYLVTEISLPTTLTVGSYELHVTIRDETTGSQDEYSIPLGIVADPGLVTARP